MKDLAWLRPDRREMEGEDWTHLARRAFGFRLCGEAMDDVDERGQPITADTLLVLMNAGPVPVAFVVPDADGASFWDVVVDTGYGERGGLMHQPRSEDNDGDVHDRGG